MPTAFSTTILPDPELASCLAATESFPNTSAPQAKLGQLFLQRKAYRAAGEAFRRALALGADDGWIHAGMADVASASGALLSAARSYEAASQRFHGNQPWLFLAANAYWELGWTDAALARFANLPRPLPDWWAGVYQNAKAAMTTHRATALRCLAMLRSGTIDAGAAGALLMSLLPAGRLRAAQGLAIRLAATFPEDLAIAEARARIAFRIEGPQAGLALLAQHPGVVTRSQAAAELGAIMAIEAGDLNLAAACLDKTLHAKWTGKLWAMACRVRIAAGDLAGLTALAEEWIAASKGSDSAPYQFMLEGLRQAGGLPLLREEAAKAASPPASPGPGLGLLQFWNTPTPPPDVAAVIATWAEMNPDLPRSLLDEAGARAFIKEAHGATAAHCFDLCHHAAMKSDYLRLLWLFTHGGLYADIDDRCIRPVAPVLAALQDSEVVVVLARLSPPYFNNCLIAARPRSALLGLAIKEATERILWGAKAGQKLSIWNDTGPGLLTRTMVRALMRTKTPAAARAVATVIPDYMLTRFTRNDPALVYKMTQEGNWRLA